MTIENNFDSFNSEIFIAFNKLIGLAKRISITDVANFITIISFLYSNFQLLVQQGYEEKIIDRLRKIEDGISQIDIKLNSTRPMHITTQNCILRADPTSKSRIIARLNTNSLVKVTCEEGDWLYVEYTDFASNTPPCHGYVYSKFIKPFDLLQR